MVENVDENRIDEIYYEHWQQFFFLMKN